ncbi:virulence RhuM family protein [uncultured Thiodictyon sp.]|uniref:virulence RhuM family protein n=1 Tax=uncultured Thiodictyon sp. TaxID=1846217 RepID=UPI0025E11A67|nr:virulence RhuM family protein [uncultured Thiodictyon sp.]
MSGQEQENPGGSLLIYRADDAAAPIRVLLEGDTVWLTQRQIAELYGTSVPNINQHITAIYEEEELRPEATLKKYLIVQTEGKRQIKRLLDHYNLEMIIALGYRVRSTRGTQFRQWATARLSEYLVKGFTLDDERLKGTAGPVDYFDELLARIRDIRASEARVYQRIRDIFALASDYREGERETQRFFAAVQNKMHFAATGLTAAEIVYERAIAEKPNMGATNWKGRQLLKRDVGTAKNYLDSQEIDTLNRITVMFLDQAEFRAQRRQDIRMGDWEGFLDKFLHDTELPVLQGAGRISHQDALDHANREYDAFAERRRLAAEAEAEARYIEDLKASAELLGAARKQPAQKSAGKGQGGEGQA